MDCTSDWAAWSDVPSRSLATVRQYLVARRVISPQHPMAVQASALSGNLNCGGMTPTIVKEPLSVLTCLPTTAGLPPKRVCHNRWLSMRLVVGYSSSATSKPFPSKGRTPSVSKKFHVTRVDGTVSGRSEIQSEMPSPENAARFSKLVDCSRQSRKSAGLATHNPPLGAGF